MKGPAPLLRKHNSSTGPDQPQGGTARAAIPRLSVSSLKVDRELGQSGQRKPRNAVTQPGQGITRTVPTTGRGRHRVAELGVRAIGSLRQALKLTENTKEQPCQVEEDPFKRA